MSRANHCVAGGRDENERHGLTLFGHFELSAWQFVELKRLPDGSTHLFVRPLTSEEIDERKQTELRMWGVD